VFLDAKHVVGASTWRSSVELDLPVLTFCARTAPQMLHMQSSLLREALNTERKFITVWPVYLSGMHDIWCSRECGSWLLEVRS
jgi:hypothetical protein